MSSFYDHTYLHDHAADEAADLDARRDAVRDNLEIEPLQLAERLAQLTDAQFEQFCGLVLDAKDKELRYMVREVICKAVIDKAVEEVK
jgi:hypothetical protein